MGQLPLMFCCVWAIVLLPFVARFPFPHYLGHCLNSISWLTLIPRCLGHYVATCVPFLSATPSRPIPFSFLVPKPIAWRLFPFVARPFFVLDGLAGSSSQQDEFTRGVTTICSRAFNTSLSSCIQVSMLLRPLCFLCWWLA